MNINKSKNKQEIRQKPLYILVHVTTLSPYKHEHAQTNKISFELLT
jgi:hypothetical protein